VNRKKVHNMDRIINILFDGYDEDEYVQEQQRRLRLIRPRVDYLEICNRIDFSFSDFMQ